MASKTSDGVISFVKYVKNNPKWSSSMAFYIEEDAPVVDIRENKAIETGVVLPAGTKIKIVTRNYSTLRGNANYTKIKTELGLHGFISLLNISKPTSSEMIVSPITGVQGISQLELMIKKISIPATIIVKRTSQLGNFMEPFEIKEVTHIRRVSGFSRANLSLNNKYGSPVFWISHNPIIRRSIFRLYEDINERSGSKIYHHPEVQDFLETITQFIEEKWTGIQLHEETNAFKDLLGDGILDLSLIHI